MEAIKKLHEARQKIKKSKIEKKGYNAFSKYKYFTPEQIGEICSNSDYGLFNKFDLVRTEQGLTAKLSVTDIDTGKSVDFQIATEIPEIKATNVAQQLGGCVTYSERYLLMIAYDIKDNSLDFDSQDNSNKPEVKKPKLTPDSKKWSEAIKHVKNGGTLHVIKKHYEITEEDIQTLILASEL